jgi:hypothetical protein
MMARRLAWLVAILTLVASGLYVFVYLYRWEWNRALTAGVIFLATEIAVVGALILDRLHRMRDVRARLSGSASRPALAPSGEPDAPRRDHFAWLNESSSRLSVFIPVLLGAGILLSALAWLVERVARAASRPGLEWGMPEAIDALALPNEPLVGSTELPGSDARARLLAPGRIER